jgi:two-component system, chemotaxis family, CheB/CheR fusion protein
MPEKRPGLAISDSSPSGAPHVGLPKSSSGAAVEHQPFLVVAIGASAGGLDACRRLLDTLPKANGMAFIMVQHLDPNHESMMVELLASHTSMKVWQAADGMTIEPDNLYVIPPGAYLSVAQGALHVVAPKARHGSRLPFDFLLHALAEDYGQRSVCVVLSGTGTDGSLGLKSIKERSGFVIAQKPEDAGYDGMPRSAIATGGVDRVLPATAIAAALVSYRAEFGRGGVPVEPPNNDQANGMVPRIIEFLRSKSEHDFSFYKQGTLQRRIERRMSLASIDRNDWERYLAILKNDPGELELLAKDLLINVTKFFRDPKVFDLLAATIVPDLVRNHSLDQPLRIWIAGCSSGEEAYSLAMLFLEQIAAQKRNVKLQVFASDADSDAIATAREGYYPTTISADVSPERLDRYFSREDHGFKVSPDLRSTVVFTVQDVLTDPPFSRLDLVSCRNLLIYLAPEAQAKVIALFHFALRQGGILLLGTSETAGPLEGVFEVISKPDRLYRTIGRSGVRDLSIARNATELARSASRPGQAQAPTRQAALAELCRRTVLETHSPAAVLINARHECLYSLGPTHRYLRIAQGHPTQELLAMAPGGLRTKLRSAIHRVGESSGPVVVPGGHYDLDGVQVSFDIAIQTVAADSEDLMLICFVDGPPQKQPVVDAGAPVDTARVAELERELEATRTELQGAIHNLEISGEEQKAINEEALSVNEEFQSTNEELLTSKEELQSLNEELTALNTQLHETLDRQRTTSNDLQNVLYSTDVATLFLDASLNIRFFTPATRSLFNVIPGDVGRPLADLKSLSADTALADDARAVLSSLAPIEREIETRSDMWFMRRILPYRAHDNKVEGVVITFTDISERKAIKKALEEAKQAADFANVAKSRFLAAASHDLRQPLQTLTLLQALLARAVDGEKAPKLVARLGETLGAMTGMLNTLLDINQIEAGIVRAMPVSFPINDILEPLRDEFTYLAQARNLSLRVVPCSLHVHSDPSLLEQVMRNLISNALKYTKHGKVLIGCRRRRGAISIEIWDTGIGMPNDELQAIFDEYHQLDNEARERNRGLGLGLSIVKRLVKLLDHRIHVRSRLGMGSVFALEVMVPIEGAALPSTAPGMAEALVAAREQRHGGSILVVEDDPDIRELVELLLVNEGHQVKSAVDGYEAIELVAGGKIDPALVLADFNLPKGMNGLQVAAKLREKLGRAVPVIILTGDISTATMLDIDRQQCVQMNKPVKLKQMMLLIQRLLTIPAAPVTIELAPRSAPILNRNRGTIYVVDDDTNICDGFRAVLQGAGHVVETFTTSEAFLKAYHPGRGGCLLVDGYLPGLNGLQLLHRLREVGDRLPAIMITGSSDVQMAVQTMKAGASDFIEKPVSAPALLAGVERALEQSHDLSKAIAWRADAASHIANLTSRQRQIMDMVLAGHPSKNIAADLGISQRTVENHRAVIMKKTGSKSLPALARLALAASGSGST